ncbi:hypothetical protein DEIGR_103079 [Deinococcus grandis]|uniref:Uncharacterized protein n=1 Tax=Deinococcus grandis TaxID=57498 RepID=A0A117DP96_9DEIO|nr:hypothetical protein DEIGR_103079 [Deinococcus grandis]
MQDFTGAFEGHEVRHVQIHRQGVDPWTVLHLSRDVRGEGCSLPGTTSRADLDVGAVFGDLKVEVGEVMNLSSDLGVDWNVIPVLPAGAVSRQREIDDDVGMRGHLEGLAGVIGLSARRPAGLLALTLGLPGLVLTGRLTGCGAVSGQLSFDGAKFSQHLSELGFEFTDACLESFAVWAGDLADGPPYPIDSGKSPC